MTDSNELAIDELMLAKKMLDEFIETLGWNSTFRKKNLKYIIEKLESVRKNLWIA